MSNPDGFLRLLALLGREGQPVRIARGNASTFDHSLVEPSNLAPVLEALEQNEYSVWFELNESSFDRAAGRSNAADIRRLTALYADLDFKEQPGGMGDLPSAMQVVSDLSNALGYQPSAIVHSGHGIQPYWPIADGVVRGPEIARMLKRWGVLVKKFAVANHGNADSVFDLARILRVPGSVNFKDLARPVPATIDFAPDAVDAITVEEIDQVLDDYEIDDLEAENFTGEIVSSSAEWEWAEHSCQQVRTFAAEIESSTPAARHPWALKWAALLPGLIRYGCITEEDYYALRDSLKQRLEWLTANTEPRRQLAPGEWASIEKTGMAKAESWSKQKLGDEMRNHTHDLADMIERVPVHSAPGVDFIRDVWDQTQPEVPRETSLLTTPKLATVTDLLSGQVMFDTPENPTAGALALDLAAQSVTRVAGSNMTDTGNAEALARHIRGKFVFVPGLGWHEWKLGRWMLDDRSAIMEAAKDLMLTIKANTHDDDMRKWAHNSLGNGRLKAALDLSKSVANVVVDTFQLDGRPYELSTPGGIANLKDGTLRAAEPMNDFHTLQTRFAPERVRTPRFNAFIEWALPDPEVREYVQMLFGAAAIGEQRWHILPIFVGVGGNGKTALIEMVAGCLGGYASKMPNKFLISKMGTSHPTEYAQLRGVRFAHFGEVPPGARFDEDVMKSLTGEPTIKARFMGKDFIEFPNMSTIMGSMNHLPTVSAGGAGFWRRVKKVDFKSVMPDERANPTLVNDMLRDEGPGILQWIIDGAVAVLRNGLHDPASVRESTQQYRYEEDAIAQFLAEETLAVDGAEVSREAVYKRYQAWVERQGMYSLKMVKFERELLTQRPDAGLLDKDRFSNMLVTAPSYTMPGTEGYAHE